MKKQTGIRTTLAALALAIALPAALCWYYDVYVNWQPNVYPLVMAALFAGTLALTLLTLRARGERAWPSIWKTLLSFAALGVSIGLVTFLINNVMSLGVRLAANTAVSLCAAQWLVLFVLLTVPFKGRVKVIVAGVVALAFIAAPAGMWLAREDSATPLKDLSRLRVSNGNRIVMERGLVLQGYTNSPPDNRLPTGFLGELGFGPTFYYEGGRNVFDRTLVAAQPDTLWAIAQVATLWGQPFEPTNGEEWLTDEQLQYIDRLVTICFADEPDFRSEDVSVYAQWFEDFRTRHPDADTLLHINLVNKQWISKQQAEYMREARPDLLTFDNYYFNADNMKKRKYHTMSALIADDTNEYRIYAMGGYDGSGEEPIPFGQYLQAFDCCCVGYYTVSESQKNLVANLTATMGGKWLDLFILSYFSVNDDGTLTTHGLEFAEIARELRNLSDHLAQLQTTDVRVVPGRHIWQGLTLRNRPPRTVRALKSGSAPHIKSVATRNLGDENDGLPGDVFIGSFTVLPGASFERKGREYFAVCNTLSSGNGLKDENRRGFCDETRQEITLTTDGKQTKTLYYVDPATGEEVPAQLDGDSVAFTLGGGKMRLFFWE